MKLTLLLGLLAAGSAHADLKECFLPPTDPSDCSLVEAARVYVAAAKTVISDEYSELGGEYSEKSMKCYMNAASYITHCLKTDCQTHKAIVGKYSKMLAGSGGKLQWKDVQARITEELKANNLSKFKTGECNCGDFRIAGKRKLAKDWTEEGDMTIKGEAGACVFDAANSPFSLSVSAPNGDLVLQGSRTTKMRTTYMVPTRVECALDAKVPLTIKVSHKRGGKRVVLEPTIDSAKTDRAASLIPEGVQVIDWVGTGYVSPNWAKRIVMTPLNATQIKLEPLSDELLRVSWPNGATVDLNKDGFSASNFVSPKMWERSSCKTLITKDKNHFIPEILLIEGQSFAKEDPHPIMN